MKTYKLLSIDETGKASYSHPSKYFIVCGVIIDESKKKQVNRSLLKIKNKYFSNPDIVLHARGIFRKAGPFSVLKNPKIEINFWSDLINVANDENISFITILVNKEKAKKRNWTIETILNRSYKSLLRRFRLHLVKTKLYGRVIVESDTQQDFFLLKSHHYHQNSSPTYRERVTSLSYVTKGNQDPDVELADSIALISRFYYERKYLYKINTKPGVIDKMKLKFLQRKLSSKSNPSYLIKLKIL